MKVYYDKDADLSLVKGKKVTIIGYGSQGHAHAQNLTESGVKVTVGLRPGGASWEKVKKAKIAVKEVGEAVKGADLVMILLPDENHAQVWTESIEPNIRKGAVLAFAHGFNIHFQQIKPPKDIDVIMIAPKGPGHTVRSEYQKGGGVPCLIAIHQDASGNAHDVALAYASGVGGGRSGIIETNFREECETDLFGEQSVLCGGLVELIRAGFETLVEAGYAPEMAYFECVHEVKLIVDLIYEGGFARMHQFVSETAKYGDLTRGPRIVDDHVRAEMKKILEEIRSGQFAREWVLENQANRPVYSKLLERDLNHPIEAIGKELRARMSWLQPQAAAAPKKEKAAKNGNGAAKGESKAKKVKA